MLKASKKEKLYIIVNNIIQTAQHFFGGTIRCVVWALPFWLSAAEKGRS